MCPGDVGDEGGMRFYLSESIMRLLRGYSRTQHEVLVLKKNEISDIVTPKVKVGTKILPLRGLKGNQLREVRRLQGRAAVAYLRLRYGSLKTYVPKRDFGWLQFEEDFDIIVELEALVA